MNENQNKEVDESGKKGNTMLGIGLAMLLACAAFFSGMQIGVDRVTSGLEMEANIFSFFSSPAKTSEEVDLDEFWKVWQTLDDKFVSSTTTDPLSNEDRILGAIDGLVNSYNDPYTVFLPPEDASDFEAEISGNFSGVGMEVGMRDSIITVIAPLPDSPAEKAGIVAGDFVVKIDGASTEGMNIDEAVKIIRGEKGTDVTLTVYRDGESEFKDVVITRDIIDIPTIKTEIAGDVFVIKLYSFNAISEAKTQEALREFIKSGKEKLVLDLRGNPGGFLQSAVSIASYFLPSGKVVVRESFGENIDEQVYRSQGKVIFDFNPDNFVVLIDGGSASASEILAGALSEHGVATTIGKKTFGKGSVQELVSLSSKASLKVTVARWLTPDGVSFSENGLEPNVSVARTPQQIIEGIDPQQQAALSWLAGNRDIGEKEGIAAILDNSNQ